MIFDASSIYLLIKLRRLTPLADEITIDLAIYELGNALWKGVRRGLLTREEALKSMGIIWDIFQNMRVIRFEELNMKEALKLAAETGLTFYDATYLHLALELGEEIITEDERLKAKAIEKGATAHSAMEIKGLGAG